MATGYRVALGGLAAMVTGMAVLVSQDGVFAAEGTGSVRVAMASVKVGSATEMIAAVRRGSSADLGRTATGDVDKSGTSQPTVVAAIEPEIPVAVAAPTTRIAPAPVVRPAKVRPAARATAPARRANRAERRRAVPRAERIARIAVEERVTQRAPRRFSKNTLPTVIGAFR